MFLTYIKVKYMTIIEQVWGKTCPFTVIRFLFYMWSGIIPFEVDCEELKIYIINSKATTKITRQKVTNNKPTYKKNKIIKNTELIQQKSEKENNENKSLVEQIENKQ